MSASLAERVVCSCCPRACQLTEGQLGACRARACLEGAIVSLGYGRCTALALDPVEKKPLRCWRPGSTVLSYGSFGCNLRCAWCQNHDISQVGRDEVAWRELMPEQLLATARRCAAEDPRMAGVAFTYNEPLVAWEYVRDAAALAHEAGLGTVLVSAGCVSPTVVDAVAPHLDAANIDLKSIKPDTYRSLGGDVSCVQASIASLVAAGVHVELTCLVVPQVNDTAEEMDELATWVASVDAGIPLHVSRFFPAHRLRDRAPTAVAKVYELADVARAHLAHVYTGNC